MYMTSEQRAVLADTPYLVALDELPDGDLLVEDKDGYGPYILTRDGKVQEVKYHYHIWHKLVNYAM